MRTFTMCWIVLMLIASLSGCTQTRAVPFDKTVRPAKPKVYHIAIYDAVRINRPYKVIGEQLQAPALFTVCSMQLNICRMKREKWAGMP